MFDWLRRMWRSIFGRGPDSDNELESLKPPTFSQGEIEAAAWFQESFRDEIERSLEGTPYKFPLVLAIAMQETSYMWMNYYKKMPASEVLALCVGDTIDGRKVFPRSKRELLSAPKGDTVFSIAREALEQISQHDKAYARVAKNKDKFCHGFGIFQYDIQYFEVEPDFFLERKWHDFGECLKVLMTELRRASKAAFKREKEELTPQEMTYIAIAYNAGRVNLNGNFKQGHQDDSGQYYGERIWRYLQLTDKLPPWTPKPSKPEDPLGPGAGTGKPADEPTV